MLKLTDIEELTELVYKRNALKMNAWLKKKYIEDFKVYTILDNDRCLIFKDPDCNNVYIIVAGSDDKQDWKENFMVTTIKRLFYGFKGYALPAEAIVTKLVRFCKDRGLSIFDLVVILGAHSRGSGIIQNVYRQLFEYSKKIKVYGWGFGGPGGGGKRFAKGLTNALFTKFWINGDPVPICNPFHKDIGKVVKLPKQIDGFWNRLFKMFKGDFNHRRYECIGKIFPFSEMNARGEY